MAHSVQLALSLITTFLLLAQVSDAQNAKLKILGAAYGRADVTNLLQKRVTSGQSLHVEASNRVFGDSWPGVRKTLVVVYQQEGYYPQVQIVREHHGYLHIYSRPVGHNTQIHYPHGHYLRIIGAAYGLADVTHRLQNMVQYNHLNVRASNRVFGDTLRGERKTLVVVYQHGNGGYRMRIVTEGHSLHIS